MIQTDQKIRVPFWLSTHERDDTLVLKLRTSIADIPSTSAILSGKS